MSSGQVVIYGIVVFLSSYLFYSIIRSWIQERRYRRACQRAWEKGRAEYERYERRYVSKVNLEYVRNLRHIIACLEEAAAPLRAELISLPAFCQDCGATDTPFYPLQMSGPDSLSPYLCVECEKKRRGAARESTEGDGS